MASQLPPCTFVVVSGPPANGKTTLARAIAPALDLPLIAKDTIKQALMRVLPGQTSRPRASSALPVLRPSWRSRQIPVVPCRRVSGTAAAPLMTFVVFPGHVVEVFCRCDPRISAQRYALRAGTRDVGHFDAERTIEELWNNEVAQPVAARWPVIEVSTSSPVELTPLTARIRAAAAAARP